MTAIIQSLSIKDFLTTLDLVVLVMTWGILIILPVTSARCSIKRVKALMPLYPILGTGIAIYLSANNQMYDLAVEQSHTALMLGIYASLIVLITEGLFLYFATAKPSFPKSDPIYELEEAERLALGELIENHNYPPISRGLFIHLLLHIMLWILYASLEGLAGYWESVDGDTTDYLINISTRTLPAFVAIFAFIVAFIGHFTFKNPLSLLLTMIFHTSIGVFALMYILMNTHTLDSEILSPSYAFIFALGIKTLLGVLTAHALYLGLLTFIRFKRIETHYEELIEAIENQD